MKLYHVTTVENAKSIIEAGTKNNHELKFNRGAFYFFTSLKSAKLYCKDEHGSFYNDYGELKSPVCILQFEIEPNAKDFNIDYEGSYPLIFDWIIKNSKEIARVSGYFLKEKGQYVDKFSEDVNINRTLVSPEKRADEELTKTRRSLGDIPQNQRPLDDIPQNQRPLGLVKESLDACASLQTIEVYRRSREFGARSRQMDCFYHFISQFPQLEESMEKFVFDNPGVRSGEIRLALAYFGPPVFPEKVLSPEGDEIQLQQEGFASRKIVVERWQRLAGILK